jgi:hypothetical protein
LLGAACTQTLSGEAFGTRSEAEQAMRTATDQALRANVANRTDVVLVRRGLYAGPLPARPTYTGPTGLKAVQCTAAAPAVPAGIYEPKGNGAACQQVGVQMEARCKQAAQDCISRNCSGHYSGCSVDCPGCAGSTTRPVHRCIRAERN